MAAKVENLFDLSGKVIAITGGYGYLGKSITLGLLSHGATVWVLARNKEKFQQSFQNIKSGSERLHFCFCDISRIDSIQAAFEMIIKNSGSLNGLINNAFYMSGRKNKKFNVEDWDSGIEGILSSTYWCILEAIPYLKQSANGRIINVSSAHGMLAPEKNMLKPPQYGVAKAGVIQLTKYFASYLGPDKITVNTITPGPFPSDKVQKDHEFMERLISKTCLHRIGQPEELMGAFVFLSSNASDYVTGHNLVVDGGFTNG